jgi:hypothetical protein
MAEELPQRRIIIFREPRHTNRKSCIVVLDGAKNDARVSCSTTSLRHNRDAETGADQPHEPFS